MTQDEAVLNDIMQRVALLRKARWEELNQASTLWRKGSASDIYESHTFRVKSARKNTRCDTCKRWPVACHSCRSNPLAGYMTPCPCAPCQGVRP